MASDSVGTFLETIRQHSLLSDRQFADLESTLDLRAATVESVGRLLLERQWLTSFQVEQLRSEDKPVLVLGPYVVLDCLGEGGMGRVYKALHRRLNRLTALKVIHPDHVATSYVAERFYREARTAACLHHPHVVTVFDADEHEGVHFLAMEYVEGRNLREVVQDDGVLSLAQACAYVCQAAAGLQHAHEQGLVHRDIKPSNLMAATSRPGASTTIKILDFGLARWTSELSEDGNLTRTGQFVGTPDYIAPEQANDSRSADIRADIFSLGCTLCFLLTGQSPFRGSNVRQRLAARIHGNFDTANLPPHLPATFLGVLRKLLAPDADDRFQTPAEAAQALQPFTEPRGTNQFGAAGDRATRDIVEPETTPASDVMSSGDTSRVATPSNTDPTPAKPARSLAKRLAPLVIVLLAVGGIAAWRLGWLESRPDAKGGENKVGHEYEARFTNSIGMKLILVPAGEFDMGSTEDEPGHFPDEAPVHRVRISRTFYMGEFEVTQGQYTRVVNENPSYFSATGMGKDALKGQNPDELPVENITWDEADRYCRALSDLPEERKQGRSYRLPTEAEWEYACRAGTKTPYHSGTLGLGNLGNTAVMTMPGGNFKANAFGLHDMHGNVWEWCSDVYSPYRMGEQTDPKGPKTPGDRVIRGGGWNFAPEHCRSARRLFYRPTDRYQYHGIRVVCEMDAR